PAVDAKDLELWRWEGGEALSTVPPTVKRLGELARAEPVEMRGQRGELRHGAVVIAAITSCTNTSNPSVMLGAGILARKAVARGLKVKPWVKNSLAPGSQVVSDY